MAKIQDIKLDGQTNWAGVADAALRLLSVDDPQTLSAEDRKELVSTFSVKSKVSVRMHTKLTYGQMLSLPLAEKAARQEHARQQKKQGAKPEEFDRGWFLISQLCESWTGLKDPDNGEELPFSVEGLHRADVQDVAQIIDMVNRVSQGNDPNA
ncbi:MAG: hypothetical protein EPN91_00045 [Salinibacterium sp.]|nr:MAG: hypothetical protein EPN91_00045 [Salinibacterium sp.]